MWELPVCHSSPIAVGNLHGASFPAMTGGPHYVGVAIFLSSYCVDFGDEIFGCNEKQNFEKFIRE